MPRWKSFGGSAGQKGASCRCSAHCRAAELHDRVLGFVSKHVCSLQKERKSIFRFGITVFRSFCSLVCTQEFVSESVLPMEPVGPAPAVLQSSQELVDQLPRIVVPVQTSVVPVTRSPCSVGLRVDPNQPIVGVRSTGGVSLKHTVEPLVASDTDTCPPISDRGKPLRRLKMPVPRVSPVSPSTC